MDNLMIHTARELTDEQAGGHGNRWDVFAGGVDSVMRWLSTMVQEAELVTSNLADKADADSVIAGGEPRGALLLNAIQKEGRNKTGAMALIGVGPGGEDHKPENQLWSAYPFFGDGVEVEGVVDRILLHPNRLEALLEVETVDGVPVTIFDTLFCHSRALYRSGETYRFTISALAYSMEPAKPLEYVIDNPEEIRRIHAREAWAKEHGHWEKENEADALAAWSPQTPKDLEPIRINASRMTALLPGSNGVDDDATYMGEVVRATPDAVQMLDTSFWRVDVNLLSSDGDMAVAVPVYVAETLFAGEWRPHPRQYVSGALWLQGYAKTAVG